jgi:nucleotide-binding universal stress UspA family protein
LPYKKILVPYDTSKPSDGALEHAIKIAKAGPDATVIIILHVIPEIPIYPVVEHAVRSRKDSRHTAFEEHIQFVYSALKEETAKILEEKKRKYEQEIGSKNIKIEVIRGKPAAKIVEYAKSEAVELIIMGSSGLTGMSRLMALGSVSRGVLETAKCPVMIVH